MRTGIQDVFAFHLPTKIIHGINSSRETGNECKDLKISNALIVTDHGIINSGLLEGILRSLDAGGIQYTIFDEVEEDPCGATIAKGASLASDKSCDGIVVVGGGSPICAGRGIGVIVTNGGHIRDYAGINKAANPPLPLIAIPTTAGSGAEVSQFIVLKDEDKHAKMVVGSPMYFPKVAILDPLLIKTLSYWQSAISGVDALTHAIEAYLTTMTTPITDAITLTAVSLIYHNLRQAVSTNDIEAKEACLIGSTMANIACGNARLGLIHSMTTPMEGMFKIPHGIANGILLPYVMEFNRISAVQRFCELAEIMGQPDDGLSDDDLSLQAIVAVKKLLIDLDFPREYSDSQIDRNAIPEFAKRVMAGLYGVFDPDKEYPMDAIVSSANIRNATMKDVIELYEKAFKGWQL